MKGMLIVTANPPAGMEDEFNAWYELEHLPERLAVPGFETGLRYVMLGVPRRYIAFYDLEEIGVLSGPAYMAVSNEHPTPWTKRVVGQCRFGRFATSQLFPGTETTRSPARMLVVHVKGRTATAADAVIAGAQRNFAAIPGVCLRVFATEQVEDTDFFVLVGSDGPVPEALEPGSFGPDAAVRSMGTYVPY